jgi:hypothetical protein
LKWTSDDKCTDKEKYSLTVELRCEEGATNPIPRIKSKSVEKNSCSPVMYIDTEEGCIDQSFNLLWSFFSANAVFLSILIMCIGIFLTLVGGSQPKLTLFMVGSCALTMVLLFISYMYIIPMGTPEFVHYIIIVFSLLGGALFGMVCA